MQNQINTAYFVGDVHLDSRLPGKETAFLNFLDDVIAGAPDHVFLLGDIFEFWFGYKTVMFAQPIRVISKIAEMVSRGIDVTYIVGNHDFYPGPVFENYLGVHIAYHPLRINLNDQNVYVSHGDEINSCDRGYRFLKGVLRNPLAQLFFRGIPASWAWYIGRLTSDTSRKYTDQEKEGIPDDIYSRFLEDRKAEGVDVVIHGHTHQPVQRTVETGKGKLQLINSGHWFGPGYFVEYREGEFSLKTVDL